MSRRSQQLGSCIYTPSGYSESIAHSSHLHSDLPDSIIDIDATTHFVGFPIVANQARLGDKVALTALQDLQATARTQADSMRADIGDLSITIAAFKTVFTKEEFRRFKKGRWTREMCEKTFVHSMYMADMSQARNPSNAYIPSRTRGSTNNFFFRLAMCQMFYLIQLVSDGSKRRSPDKARNDQVDVYLAAYATYFDGFMSGDKRAVSSYLAARHVLKVVGAKVSDRVF